MSTDTAGWVTIGRPGYAGHGRQARERRLNRLFGEGRWKVRHLWRGEGLDREGALALYEEAYYRHLAANPDVLDWLCRTASDVYDLAPSNVESGTDYYKQECAATHLQDIAVRRCLGRLGRAFRGDHLVQIRGRDSEGHRLNPGQVPFHEPDGIIQPSRAPGDWCLPGSVEDFWQSNKILQVSPDVPEEALRGHLLRPLTKPQGDAVRVAVFGGSFNPIHLGHLRVALDLVELYGFAQVVFVPNGHHYRKRGLIGEEHRARMVELAVAGEPRFEVCRFELGRDRVVRNYETLAHLEEALAPRHPRPELYNVWGSDKVARMLRWRSLPSVLRATQVVCVRPGGDPWREYGQDPTYRLHCDQFRLLRRDYEDGLSSTVVRERLRAGGGARFLVPEAVAAYIEEHRLYR